MSNLNVQRDLECYWQMPLTDILARQFARYGTVKAVAESLDVSPNTIRNWLFQYAQNVRELHGEYPQAIGRALASGTK